jgi:hypothetical protein
MELNELVSLGMKLRTTYRDITHGGYPSNFIVSLKDYRTLKREFQGLYRDVVNDVEVETFIGIPIVLKYEGQLEIGINPNHAKYF